MYAKHRSVERARRKGISRKTHNVSESNKHDSLVKKDDDKSKSKVDAFQIGKGNQVIEVRKRGRKRKSDGEFSTVDVKKTEGSSELCNKKQLHEKDESTAVEKNLPGMSLRKLRSTRGSGSSVSDRDNDIVIQSTDDPLKPEQNCDLENLRREEKSKPISSGKEQVEIKKSKVMQEDDEQNVPIGDADNAVNSKNAGQQSTRKPKSSKNAGIKQFDTKDKQVHQKPLPSDVCTRRSSRTLSNCSERISSGSERDLKSQETPSSDIDVHDNLLQPNNEELRKSSVQAENLNSELCTGIEQLPDISNSESSDGKTVSSRKRAQSDHPEIQPTIRKRGRPKKSSNDLVQSICQEVVIDLVNDGEKVSIKPGRKRKSILTRKPKRVEISSSAESENKEMDFTSHSEREKEHNNFSEVSLSKDSLETAVAVEKEQELPSNISIDKSCKSSLTVKKDNESLSQEKNPEVVSENVDITVVRGRRGRKKIHLAKGKKSEHETKNSILFHPTSDSEDHMKASSNKDKTAVQNSTGIRNSRSQTKKYLQCSKELTEEKLKNSPSEEGFDINQRVASMPCTVPASERIPMEANEISGDVESCLNEAEKADQSENEKTGVEEKHLKKRTRSNSGKDEQPGLDHISKNEAVNEHSSEDKPDSNHGRILRRLKQKVAVYKRKNRKIQSSVCHERKKEQLTEKEMNLGGSIVINDLSVIVEKLDLNDPEIMKLMSSSSTCENQDEKSIEIQKKQIEHFTDEDTNTTVVDTDKIIVTSKTADECLNKESSVCVDAGNVEKTTTKTKTSKGRKNNSQHNESPDQERENIPIDCAESLSNNLISTSCDVEKPYHMNKDAEKITVENVLKEKSIDMDDDKSENHMECENSNPSTFLDVKEKEDEFGNINSTANTCDENQLDAEICINPLEEIEITTDKDETSSDLFVIGKGSFDETMGKFGKLAEINQTVSESELDSKNVDIDQEDIFIVLDSCECSGDSLQSETVLISVEQDEKKEIYIDMSGAINMSPTLDDESQVCISPHVSSLPSNPTDNNLDSLESIDANIEAVLGTEVESEKELEEEVEEGEVTDSILENEIVAALEDNREVNDELEEVREVYNATLKDMEEITGSGNEYGTEGEKEVDDVDLEDGNDCVLENNCNTAMTGLSSDMIVNDENKDAIDILESIKKLEHYAAKDDSENTFETEKEIDSLKAVSKKTIEEQADSNSTREEQVNSDLVSEIPQTKSYEMSLENGKNSLFENECEKESEKAVNLENEGEVEKKGNLQNEEEEENLEDEEEVASRANLQYERKVEKEANFDREVEECANIKVTVEVEDDANNKNIRKVEKNANLVEKEVENEVNPQDERNVEKDANLEVQREVEDEENLEVEWSVEKDVRNVNLEDEGQVECDTTVVEINDPFTGRTVKKCDATVEHCSIMVDECDSTVKECEIDLEEEKCIEGDHETAQDQQRVEKNKAPLNEYEQDESAVPVSHSNIETAQSHQKKIENDACHDVLHERNAISKTVSHCTLRSVFETSLQDYNKYDVVKERNIQQINSTLKLDNSKIELPKVPVRRYGYWFKRSITRNREIIAAKKEAAAAAALKRKKEGPKVRMYRWPKYNNLLAYEYLQPFVPVLNRALHNIADTKPSDPIEYFSQWLKDHKAEAYFMMASIPISKEFENLLKKPNE